MKNLHPVTRILLIFALIGMVLAWSRPAWEIQLWAPQYPEGLGMQIWLDNITGDVDVINGLNHYIGMREIELETFPEFKIMKNLLIGLIVIGVLPILTGKRAFLWVFVGTLILAAVAGLGDFVYWSREFGNNLDPKAAISVPGMTYDPPLIGYKAILNFVALSKPAIGGYLLIGAGALATLLLTWEIWRGRKNKTKRASHSATASLLAFAPFLLLASCQRVATPINYGNEDCAECSMTLMDKKYGAQYVTGKGKTFTFDDLNCFVEYTQREPALSDENPLYYVVNFHQPNELIDATKAVYLEHEKLRSPMRADVAAFVKLTDAQAAQKELGDGGNILDWNALLKKFTPKS